MSRGRNCHVCGVFFKDTIPGYPNPEAICDDCYSDRESVKRAFVMERLDKTDSCPNCGCDNTGSAKAHALICRYEVKDENAEKNAKRAGAAQPRGRR